MAFHFSRGKRLVGVARAGALVDPQLEEPELFGGQGGSLGGISVRRHSGLALMSGHLEQQAVGAVAWNDQRFGSIAGEDLLPVFQNHVSESQALAVTGQALGLKNGKEIPAEADRLLSVRDCDGNGPVPVPILLLVELSPDRDGRGNRQQSQAKNHRMSRCRLVGPASAPPAGMEGLEEPRHGRCLREVSCRTGCTRMVSGSST